MSGNGKKGVTFKVEPLKQKVAVDPDYAEKAWAVLEDAINRINQRETSQLSFEELYRCAYNMVLHKCGDTLYSGVHSSIASHLRKVANCLSEHRGENLLRELASAWAQFNQSVRMLRDILIYMDRTYVPNHDKLSTHSLSLHLWHELVLSDPRIGPSITSTTLNMVHSERTGERIERDLLKLTSSMLSDLGLNVYESFLESPLLSTSSSFFASESHQTLAISDCRAYLLRAERRIAEEQARARECFCSSTEPNLMRVVYDELLRKHVHTLVSMPNSGLVAMADNEDTGSLKRMHSLLCSVDGGSQAMRDAFGAHLKERGESIVSSMIANDESATRFTDNLLRLKELSERVLRESFNSDSWFQMAANSAFESFVNSSAKSPEYLSLFVDDRLYTGLRSSQSESELEDVLDRAVLLFRHLRDKDVFERYYRQHLCNRLLGDKEVMEEQERGFVQRLKTQCGYAFTSKMEQMFTDVMTTSRELTRAFEESTFANSPSDTHLDIDISLRVLTTGSWPLEAPPESPWLPQEIEPVARMFESFYYSKHTGRRLSWHVYMGNANVKAVFGNGSKHELSVSTLQMCVLLLFNQHARLQLSDVERLLDIPAEEIKPAVYHLACVKGKDVLLKSPRNGEQVNPSDMLEVNESFTSKQFKLRFGTAASQRESQTQSLATKEKVEGDRKPQIEAAIVRLMKSRKVMDHTTLVNEVTRQLSWYFVPHVFAIKDRIEQLVEREFLERGAFNIHIFEITSLKNTANATP